jgi:phosphoesterase RecJ-like protein
MPFHRREYQQLEPLLREARAAAVLTHIHPDGDGVGSGLALARYLSQRGLDARFIITHPLPLSLQFLAPDGEAILYAGQAQSEFIRSCDLIFTVDNSSVSRLGPTEDDVRASKAKRVCIDHHLVRNDFWQVNIIDEEASATGEMIYDCIEELGGEIDRDTAAGIYVAIWTDTGGFRFPKTSGRVHRLVARLLDLGVLPHQVYGELNERQTTASMRLLAEALLRVHFEDGHRLAWVKITRALVAKCQAESEDTSDIMIHLLAIDGVDIALLFREESDTQTKISLRSKVDYDVNALARANGGGGHRNAAGAVVEEPLEACARRLVDDALALLR